MPLEVTTKIGNTGRTKVEKYEMSMSKFMAHATSGMYDDLNSIVKIVVVY